MLGGGRLSLEVERQRVGDLGERRSSRVFDRRRQLELGRPRDADLRIGVEKTALGLRVPVGGAAVDHVCHVADHAEAVSKPLRAVDLAVVRVAQLEGLPLPEAWRAATDVDYYIQNA